MTEEQIEYTPIMHPGYIGMIIDRITESGCKELVEFSVNDNGDLIYNEKKVLACIHIGDINGYCHSLPFDPSGDPEIYNVPRRL